MTAPQIEEGREAGRGPAPNAGGTLATLLYLVSMALMVAGAWTFDVGLALAVGGVLLAIFVTLFVLEV